MVLVGELGGTAWCLFLKLVGAGHAYRGGWHAFDLMNFADSKKNSSFFQVLIKGFYFVETSVKRNNIIPGGLKWMKKRNSSTKQCT